MTSPGAAAVADGGAPLGAFNLATKQLRGAARLAAIDTWLERLIADKWGGQVKLAAIEGYAMAAQNRPFDLGEVGGVVRLRLFRLGVPFVVVPPALVKRFAAGNGQATKDQVRQAIKRKWGLNILQEDQADAFVLAKIAHAVATHSETKSETITGVELEVVRKLLAPKGAKVKPHIARSLNL